MFSLQACKEPLIGDKTLLTKNDTLNLAKDTLHLNITSQLEKPLIVSGISEGLLGSLYDPNFGSTVAGVYAHCELTSGNISFGTSPVLDSAVFSVAYNGLYGLCNKPVNLSLYELNQDIYDSVTYYSNSSFQVKTPPIGQLNNFVPNLIDSIQNSQGNLPPEMRIRLSASFGNKILLADSSTLSSNTYFLSLFKGFYLTTNSNTVGNGLMYLNLPSSLSGITLYYHNSLDSFGLTYYLPITGAAINHFDNAYYDTPANAAVNSGSVPQQKLYLQGGIGIKGKIIITDLNTLPKNIGINKAELVFSQVAGDTAYPAPLTLSLFRLDDAGNAQYLEDQGLGTFGGTLVAESVNGSVINRYRFNISKYFQKVLQGIHNNNGLYLQVPSAATSSERVVIGNSSTDKNYQVSLVITYTKL